MKKMDQKMLLAFEYGLVFSETAKSLKIKLTPAMVQKAEEMITSEFNKETNEHLATHMQVNILSLFETDSTKKAGK